METNTLLEIKNMSKSFDGNEVLKDISLTVNKGEVISIIGPSGSGKSTALRCATLLETMDGGTLKYEGNIAASDETGSMVYADKARLKEIQTYFGLVFQNFNLFPHYSVIKNITEPVILSGRADKKTAIEQARSLLNRLGLADKENAYPSSLSGGQQQRVSIARCFLKNPPILILDEATSALDTTTEIKIQHSFDELSKGRTTLVIAHRLSTIKNADMIAVVNDKGIVEQGTHKELMDKKGEYFRLQSAQVSD